MNVTSSFATPTALAMGVLDKLDAQNITVFSPAILLSVVALLVLRPVLESIGVSPRKLKLAGPPGVPLCGNVLEFQKGQARALARWGARYGDIFKITLGNRDIVILNTYGAVMKTLVQQGAAFQSRPETWLHGAFAKALSNDDPSTIGTSKFDDTIGKYRRMLTAQTSAVKLPRFNHFAARRYFRLMTLLVDSASKGQPVDLGYHFWTTTIGISADELFGQRHDDATTEVIADTNIEAFRFRTLGQPLHGYVPPLGLAHSIVSTLSRPLLPVLRPLGLSGGIDSIYDAEAHAEKIRQTEIDYCTRLLKDLHARLDAGDPTPSQMGDMFRSLSSSLSPKEELRLAETLAGSGMSAGTGLTWLAGLLATRPDIQEKAYAAIADTYGPGNPPDPLDTDRVEYIKALGMEAGRYFTSIRLGFPRETYEDVTVDGMFVPKGTMVVYNSFQINRDESRYDKPEEFLPERWMEGRYGRTDEKTPKVGVPHLNHGAGRRVCMGVPNVNTMFYATLSLLLHFFTLERAPLSQSSDKYDVVIFPACRASSSEASAAMDPLEDQISQCDAQALPKPCGIKLIPRNPEALARWLAEGHKEMDQWERPNDTDAALPSEMVDPGLRGHYN